MSSNTLSSTPTVKHLDSEYRRRWELYTTPDKVHDSRIENWHDIPWDKVTEIRASMDGHEYTINNSGPGFQSFIRWRWGGVDNGKIINTWCIGWTDRVTCFMQEIDFVSGDMTLKEYPFEQFKKHLGE